MPLGFSRSGKHNRNDLTEDVAACHNSDKGGNSKTGGCSRQSSLKQAHGMLSRKIGITRMVMCRAWSDVQNMKACEKTVECHYRAKERNAGSQREIGISSIMKIKTVAKKHGSVTVNQKCV